MYYKCSSALVGPRKRTVEDSFMQACKDKKLGAWAAESRDWWMTMEELKLCVRWAAAVDHPRSVSFCLREQLRELTFFRKRPSAMYKDNAVGTLVAETGRDGHNWAIFQCTFSFVRRGGKGSFDAPVSAVRKIVVADRKKGLISTNVRIREQRWIAKRTRSYAFPIHYEISMWGKCEEKVRKFHHIFHIISSHFLHIFITKISSH